MKLPLRLFTVAELHSMRRTGILPPRARIELLEGILVDIPRPSARKLEVIRRLTEILSDGLGGAPVVSGGPFHPEDYAAFDPTIMVHEWDKHSLSEPYPLHRFSVEEYRRLEEVGILSSSSKLQLLDGVVLQARVHPPRVCSMLAGIAQFLRAHGGDSIIRIGEEIRLGPYSLARPDITLSDGRRDDVILVVDLAGARRAVVRDVSWPVYARWGVGAAWRVDPRKRTIEVGHQASNGKFARVDTHRAGDRITLPSPFDIEIEVEQILG